ncbi:amino acid permease [Kitasatospora sp. NBC_01287]|uniref:amino acid permease n=1 Tax=Kitasatospora sp. NBC_01287 TaxID=2903573 RepID=UPI00224DD470|nr:amino acid permease [Kitasatospora sp. NBC_01287]MCX4751164.1 amino acid permease [Kitasatospora sp. NBC_01287]
MSRTHRAAPPGAGDDDSHLQSLGYTPVLVRRMGAFGNFAVSFSVISILSGCMTLYGFGLTTGGPAVMLWGWVGVGFMVLLLGLAFAEVTSAYPTSGALYYQAHTLGGPKWGWYTGWLNLLGLLGAIAGIDYGAAQFTGALLQMQFSFTPTPGKLFVIFALILLVHALVNLRGVRLVSVLNGVSVIWHLAGVAVIVAVLALVPAHHQSAAFVFTHFANGTGWHSSMYVAAVGLLMAQYTFSGYDASAHLSEETTGASVAAPRGIVRSIWVSWIAGLVLLAGLTFAIQDYAGTVGTETGVPPAQIFLDAVGSTGAKLLLLIVIGAQLFCGAAEVAAASRMAFAFSRDGALPGSAWWRKVSPRTATPVAAVWLSVGVALVLTLPVLYSPSAYAAVTSINVVGITPAIAIPVFLRLRAGRRFRPGPWSLGRWSKPIGVVAVVWVACVTLLFCLPQVSPVTVDSFNYAGIALVVVLVGAEVSYRVAGPRYSIPVADRAMAELEAEVV